MIRKIITFLTVLLLLLVCSCVGSAAEFDPSKNGSVSVTLVEQKQNESIVGAELSVYYVATVRQNAEGKLIFRYTEDFISFDAAVDDVSLATKLDGFVEQNNVPSEKMITDVFGTASLEGLPLGLYFVKQTGKVEGFAPCTSFLVTIPGENNGEYVYEVNASPKTETVRLTSVTLKKVWNTDASTAVTDRVTVQLLKNGNVVKTAILDSKNDWQVTFADMPESDDYSIKEVDVPKGFTATYNQNGYVFTVTNTSTLIQTGQLMWPIPVFAAGGMLLLAAGIVLLKKRKENA